MKCEHDASSVMENTLYYDGCDICLVRCMGCVRWWTEMNVLTTNEDICLGDTIWSKYYKTILNVSPLVRVDVNPSWIVSIHNNLWISCDWMTKNYKIMYKRPMTLINWFIDGESNILFLFFRKVWKMCECEWLFRIKENKLE